MEFMHSDIYTYLVLPLLIFVARIADVALGTLRIIFISKGKKYIAPLLGFVEMIIWILAITRIFENLNNWACYFAFAAGFATGNFIGIVVEEKIALGVELIRIITRKEATNLIETLREKGRGVVLTDDYAPVENMLATVVRRSALGFLSGKYRERALNLESQGKLDESIAMYIEIIKIDPAESSRAWAYNDIGGILVRQGKWQQTVNAGKSAIECNEKAKVKRSMSNMHYNMSSALKKLGDNEEASKYIHMAIEGYREDLAKTPDSNKIMRHLGNALTEVGQFSEGTKYLQQAADMDPFDIKSQLTLARALLIQERYDEAIEQLGEGIRFMLGHGRKDDAAALRRLLRLVELRVG